MLSSFVLMSRILCCELWRNTLSASFAFSHLARTMAANECSMFVAHSLAGLDSEEELHAGSPSCPSTDTGAWGQTNLTSASKQGSRARALQLHRKLAALPTRETAWWFAFLQ